MRTDQDPWRPPQRMVLGQRLGIGDVQAGAGNPARFQRIHQVGGNRAGAAPHRHEVRAGLHGREKGCVEQAARRVRQRRRIDHHVGLPGQVQRFVGQADVVHVVRTIPAAAAGRDDAHAEAMGAPRRLGADAAQADDQHGAALQLHEILARQSDVALPDTLQLVRVVAVEAAHQGHHQRDRVLGERGRGDVLAVGQHHTASGERRVAYAAVHARRINLHPVQRWALRHDFLGATADQHLRVADFPRRFLGRLYENDFDLRRHGLQRGQPGDVVVPDDHLVGFAPARQVAGRRAGRFQAQVIDHRQRCRVRGRGLGRARPRGQRRQGQRLQQGHHLQHDQRARSSPWSCLVSASHGHPSLRVLPAQVSRSK